MLLLCSGCRGKPVTSRSTLLAVDATNTIIRHTMTSLAVAKLVLFQGGEVAVDIIIIPLHHSQIRPLDDCHCCVVMTGLSEVSPAPSRQCNFDVHMFSSMLTCCTFFPLFRSPGNQIGANDNSYKLYSGHVPQRCEVFRLISMVLVYTGLRNRLLPSAPPDSYMDFPGDHLASVNISATKPQHTSILTQTSA